LLEQLADDQPARGGGRSDAVGGQAQPRWAGMAVMGNRLEGVEPANEALSWIFTRGGRAHPASGSRPETVSPAWCVRPGRARGSPAAGALVGIKAGKTSSIAGARRLVVCDEAGVRRFWQTRSCDRAPRRARPRRCSRGPAGEVGVAATRRYARRARGRRANGRGACPRVESSLISDPTILDPTRRAGVDRWCRRAGPVGRGG